MTRRVRARRWTVRANALLANFGDGQQKRQQQLMVIFHARWPPVVAGAGVALTCAVHRSALTTSVRAFAFCYVGRARVLRLRARVTPKHQHWNNTRQDVCAPQNDAENQ